MVAFSVLQRWSEASPTGQQHNIACQYVCSNATACASHTQEKNVCSAPAASRSSAAFTAVLGRQCCGCSDTAKQIAACSRRHCLKPTRHVSKPAALQMVWPHHPHGDDTQLNHTNMIRDKSCYERYQELKWHFYIQHLPSAAAMPSAAAKSLY